MEIIPDDVNCVDSVDEIDVLDILVGIATNL